MSRLSRILSQNPELRERFTRVRKLSRNVRSSEYHLTHACNLRCHGCWFFEYGFDTATGRDVKDLGAWREFVAREHERGVTLSILIGGEPTLFPDRIRAFVDVMPYVWISTNGLKRIPMEGFENVAVAVTMFGGGPLDDELRGIAPSRRRLTGLFDTAIENYRDDHRVFFVYALAPESVPYLEETVGRIADNGNQVLFNYYSEHSGDFDSKSPEIRRRENLLLETALEVTERYPDTVLSHPYYTRTLITGESHFGHFGYDVCPSISTDYAGNEERLANGNPSLPGFNVYAPDLETVNMCCTSGHCDQCRDSQAVSSWLVVSAHHFADSVESFTTWLEIAESFWRQFVWSPYHRSRAEEFRPRGIPLASSGGTSESLPI